MNADRITLSLVALMLVTQVPVIRAAGGYANSLQAGDDLRTARKFDGAVAEYDKAFKQAADDGQRSLALGKKASVLATDKKDYRAAKALAEQALKNENLLPVAQVIALQALGECQLKGDKDYEAACVTLEKACKLEGVDWAQPFNALLLGDSYRLSGRFEDAVKVLQGLVDKSSDKALNAIAYLNMAFSYQYGLKDYEKARAAYEKVVQLDPTKKEEVGKHLAAIP